MVAVAHRLHMSTSDMVVSEIGRMGDIAHDRWARPAAEALPGSGPVHRAAQVGTIISIVVIGIVTLIGILIFAQVSEALPELETDSALDNAMTEVTSGFAGAMELVPIVLLVLVASLVIGVVQRMRMSGR